MVLFGIDYQVTRILFANIRQFEERQEGELGRHRERGVDVDVRSIKTGKRPSGPDVDDCVADCTCVKSSHEVFRRLRDFGDHTGELTGIALFRNAVDKTHADKSLRVYGEVSNETCLTRS